MRMKALKSFASREVAAAPGQVFTCSEALAADLIQAKFAQLTEDTEPAKKKTAPEIIPEAKEIKTEKKEAADEGKRVDNNRNKPAAKGKRSRSK